MTTVNNVYRVPGCFIAVKTHDKQHCLKCKTMTEPVPFGYRFKLLSIKLLSQKSFCRECGKSRRTFCTYIGYNPNTLKQWRSFPYKRLRYVTSKWMSSPLTNLLLSESEVSYANDQYNRSRPRFRRSKLPRKYPYTAPDVRAVRTSQQHRYPPSQQTQLYPPSSDPNRDYYNYRNNIVQPQDGAK